MNYIFPFLKGGLTKILAERFGDENILYFLILSGVLTAICAYLLGSINTAVLISKKLYGSDIRNYGSGNAGMTNMFRTFGTKAGVLTLIGDSLKAFVSVVIGLALYGNVGGCYIAGFFCILGHVMPLYYHFKGGKGVIVAAITVLCIEPWVFAVLLVIFGLMFWATRIISLSSISAAFFYPMVVYAFHRNNPSAVYILFSLAICIFIILMHRDNIIRLSRGEEKKFSIHKDDSKKKK